MEYECHSSNSSNVSAVCSQPYTLFKSSGIDKHFIPLPLALLWVLPALICFCAGLPLWFSARYALHRYFGLFWIFQYCAAWYIYYTDVDWYLRSWVGWSLPFNGAIQALSAVLTFTFLSKKVNSGGYFGDKMTMSYAFIKENLFFQILVVQGSIYYTPAGRALHRASLVGRFVEIMFVFFQYTVMRPYFPKTSFREAISSNARVATDKNQTFYFYGVYVIKVFYVAMKHFGNFVLITRFLDGWNENDEKLLAGWTLANAGTVSLAIFLHTLRFKRALPPRVAYGTYVLMAYAPFYFQFRMLPSVWRNFHLFLPIVAGGTLTNFMPLTIHHFFLHALFVVFGLGYYVTQLPFIHLTPHSQQLLDQLQRFIVAYK